MTEKELGKMTDEELVALAQAGDDTARDSVFYRYANFVRAHSRSLFLVDGEPEDLLQEGMLGLQQAILKYEADKGSFKNFAGLCIRRKLLDAVKTAKRKHKIDCVSLTDEWLAYADSDPEQKLIQDEDRRALNKTIVCALTDTEFKVFTMWRDGASFLEICEATGKNYKSIDNAIQRSRQKLKKVLTEKKA